MDHYQDYFRAAYDLILESEGQTSLFLDDEVEFYLVQLFAKNFHRTDIYQEAIALRMLQVQKRSQYQPIADECLLINSWPIRHQRWPSESYYKDMGCIAYGLAGLSHMEENFIPASQILHTVLKKTLSK